MQREEEIIHRRAIFVNVFQIVLVLAYCIYTFLRSIASESIANNLSAQMADVPWTDRLVGTTNKIDSFFKAMDVLDANLTSQKIDIYMGFGMILMLLIQILGATAIHPRLGVLINTVSKGLDGLSHFVVLFGLVFVLFSVVSLWMFGADYDEL